MIADPVHEAELLAADAIGDIIEHWGFRKGLGRLWTVLFIAGEPLPAQAIGERLTMSAGAVSMSLTELQRESVTLAYYGGYSYREVAELLDANLATIKARMRDGLIRMRDCLGVVTG